MSTASSRDPNGDADLARRVQRLEDIEAIRNIRAEYALAADARQGCAVDVERTMKLFARNGVWDGSPRFGRHEGWANVRDHLLRGAAGIDWSLHSLTETGISIASDAQTARSRWYLLELANMMNKTTAEREMVWLAGIYDNDYIREDGVWKIATMRFDCQKIIGPAGIWPEPPAAGR